MKDILCALAYAGFVPGLLLGLFIFAATGEVEASILGFGFGAVNGIVGGVWAIWYLRETIF